MDLGDNRNLFTVSVILITGVGGMALQFGKVTVTAIAAALILGIVTNLLVNIRGKKKDGNEQLVMDGVTDGAAGVAVEPEAENVEEAAESVDAPAEE